MSSLLAHKPSSGKDPNRGKVRMMPSSEQPLSAPQRLSASLTLASGSRAGMVVKLHSGFYLIGRNAECQVRPKSRSVSRRHCLVRHQQAQLHVLDLGSTSGTHLNGEKMQPRLWYSLADGDQLRCGKIAFAISAVPAEATSIAADAASDPPSGGPRTADQAAWQAEDIADWMTDFDQLEQAERIQTIRTQAVADVSDPNAHQDPATTTDDTRLPDATASSPERSESRSPARPEAAGRSRPSQGKSPRFYLPSMRLPGFSLPGFNFSEGERWKTVLAGVLFVVAIAWLLASLFYLGDDSVYQQVKTLET